MFWVALEPVRFLVDVLFLNLDIKHSVTKAVIAPPRPRAKRMVMPYMSSNVITSLVFVESASWDALTSCQFMHLVALGMIFSILSCENSSPI